MSRTALGALVLTLCLAGCLQPAAGLFGIQTGPDLPTSLIRDDPYSKLVVEIDSAPGAVPCASSLQILESNLRFLTAKESITIVRDTVPSGDGDYSNAELIAIHQKSAGSVSSERYVHGEGDTAYLHIIFLDGHATTSNGGHAAGRTIYDYGALFIFPDTYSHVKDDGREASCDVERTVLLHEMGHAFGLVNRGIPMLTERQGDHPGHSNNPSSVMYPALRFDSNGRITGDLPRGFDADDVKDITAFRAA